MRSQPTDRFSPRRRRRPLLFITTEWRQKLNGENLLCFDDFTFFYSPFFQFNCYFRGYRAIRDIAAHRRIFAPAPPPSTRVVYKIAATQKEGENLLCFDDFTSFSLTLFSINLLFSGLSRDP